MNILPLETWVSIAALLTLGFGLAAYMRILVLDLKADLGTVKSDLGGRCDRIDIKIDSVKAELGDRIDGVRTELGDRIDSVRTELGDGIDSVKTELGERIDRLDTKVDDVRADLGGRIDRLETRVATLDDRVYTLAVGMRPLLDRAEKTAAGAKPAARAKTTRTA